MLRYAGYTWLLDVRNSPVRARIKHSCRERSQVLWQLRLNYIAAGKEWRRTSMGQRPSLCLSIYDFKPNVQNWRELEGRAYSSEEDAEGCSQGGYFSIDIHNLDSTQYRLGFGDHRLRFLQRHGSWFTTELAVVADTVDLKDLLAEKPQLVTAHGDVEEAPPADRWVEEAALYVVEDLPFGLVEVEVPVNTSNPERYARARAHDLLGLGRIEDCDLAPDVERSEAKLKVIPGGDWRVRLHCGGHWTHYNLNDLKYD